jgi:hypothetical protein
LLGHSVERIDGQQFARKSEALDDEFSLPLENVVSEPRSDVQAVARHVAHLSEVATLDTQRIRQILRGNRIVRRQVLIPISFDEVAELFVGSHRLERRRGWRPRRFTAGNQRQKRECAPSQGRKSRH